MRLVAQGWNESTKDLGLKKWSGFLKERVETVNETIK